MAFVPAGYYECPEEDEFDFGDNYIQEEGPVGPTEPEETALSTQDPSLKSPDHAEDIVGKGYDVGSASPVSPGKGGKGSLSSTEFSLDISESSTGSHGNESGNKDSSSSPVTFKISTSRQESVDSVEPSGGVSGREVTESTGTFTRSGGRGESCDLGGESCDMGTMLSSGKLKSLELEEDMKVAITRGNVEQVTRILDEGR